MDGHAAKCQEAEYSILVLSPPSPLYFNQDTSPWDGATHSLSEFFFFNKFKLETT